jgi:hexokinase
MAFPDGNETGKYLALDMGGTNLRVCEVTLTEEKGEFEIIQSKYRMQTNFGDMLQTVYSSSLTTTTRTRNSTTFHWVSLSHTL